MRCYSGQASKLLAHLPDPLEHSLAALDAATVTAFIVAQATAADSVWSAKAQVTATRALLQAHDGVTTPAGLRDHAVLVALARLGLRGAEVAALRLEDVDWRGGQMVIRGKGARLERLPLPAEVGAALVAYRTRARPTCECATLFVTVRAPYQPLTATSVRAIMGRACQRAGLPRVGAHRLRHSLATDLLRAGRPGRGRAGPSAPKRTQHGGLRESRSRDHAQHHRPRGSAASWRSSPRSSPGSRASPNRSAPRWTASMLHALFHDLGITTDLAA